MLIKNNSNKNVYTITENGIRVRDFTKTSVPYVDINQLTKPEDYRLLLHNEVQNKILRMQHIDTENIYHKKVVIVSNGLGYKQKQHLLLDIPSDVVIIAVNGALAEWELLEGTKKQKINYYLVNNPYPECMGFFPRQNRYFPKCIASMRTNPEFTRQYAKKGTMYRYVPVPEKKFSGMKSDALYHIDDYRNPICAAIGFAYRSGAEKILMFCCDDAFSEGKDGMIKVEDSWVYHQQMISSEIIDANFYWLKNQEDIKVEIVDHSSGVKYKNADYIENDNFVEFFNQSGKR